MKKNLVFYLFIIVTITKLQQQVKWSELNFNTEFLLKRCYSSILFNENKFQHIITNLIKLLKWRRPTVFIKKEDELRVNLQINLYKVVCLKKINEF